MSRPNRYGRQVQLGFGLLAITAPILAFYAILLRESQNLPELDDYDAVLDFLNTFFVMRGAGARLDYFFSLVHVQYKLLFEKMVFVLEAALTGRVDFLFLQQLGNAFVLPIVLLLWLLFNPPGQSRVNKLVLFTPVVLVLFSLQYAGTMDWAMGSLQNVTVIFFSLLCFYLLPFPDPTVFNLACGSLILAIASSGNGFFVGLLGTAFLLQLRQRSRAAVWVLLTVFMAGVYAYHYRGPPKPPNPFTLHQVHVFIYFPFLFIGSAFGRYIPSLLLGLIITAFAVYLVRKQWRDLDPRTFYVAAFIAITALAVAYSRNYLGFKGAFVPRYRIYSQLLIAVLYVAALNLPLHRALPARFVRPVLVAFTCTTLLFCVGTDIIQSRLLHRRMQLVREHYAGWTCDPTHVSLIPDEDPAMGDPEMMAFRGRARRALQRSRELGLYRPPAQPACQVAAQPR